MYDFILTQWIMRKIDAAKVISYAPKWITLEQAEGILVMPQIAD